MKTTSIFNPNLPDITAMASLIVASVVLILFIFSIIVGWKLFKKAGIPGWFVLIPILNIVLYYDLVKRKRYLLINFGAACLPYIISLILILYTQQNYILVGSFSYYLITMLYIIIGFIPLVIQILFCLRLAKVYGKTSLFALGLIFLPLIFFPVLAFGSSEYDLKHLSERLTNDEITKKEQEKSQQRYERQKQKEELRKEREERKLERMRPLTKEDVIKQEGITQSNLVYDMKNYVNNEPDLKPGDIENRMEKKDN